MKRRIIWTMLLVGSSVALAWGWELNPGATAIPLSILAGIGLSEVLDAVVGRPGK